MPIRILRQLDWIPKALQQYATRNPTPSGYWELFSPTFDAFGTSRIGEMQTLLINGTLGGLEVFHTAVPTDTWRYYISCEYSHDDAVNRFLSPARLVRGTSGVIISRFRDEISVPANQILSIRTVSVGPGDNLAIETQTIGAGARLIMKPVWIDLPIGETITSVI